MDLSSHIIPFCYANVYGTQNTIFWTKTTFLSRRPKEWIFFLRNAGTLLADSTLSKPKRAKCSSSPAESTVSHTRGPQYENVHSPIGFRATLFFAYVSKHRHNMKREDQQDATIRCLLLTSVSTCFGHHYAHLQENKGSVTSFGVLLWFCWMWLVVVVGALSSRV